MYSFYKLEPLNHISGLKYELIVLGNFNIILISIDNLFTTFHTNLLKAVRFDPGLYDHNCIVSEIIINNN